YLVFSWGKFFLGATSSNSNITAHVHPAFFRCFSNASPMCVQWLSNVCPMFLQWFSNGSPMVVQCFSNVCPMCVQCSSNGSPSSPRRIQYFQSSISILSLHYLNT